jgi:LCP family protein required for cell wall assembly
MKLFGSNRKGQHVKSRSESKAEKKKNAAASPADAQTAETKRPGKWKSIPLPVKILLIVLAVILVLAIVAVIWWKVNVKPPEASSEIDSINRAHTTVVEKVDENGDTIEVEVAPDNEEVFKRPTRTEVVTDEETGEEVEYEIPVSKKEGFYNILIVGTDGDGGRTDTIMIASLDTTTNEVALMSVPRDTYISASYSVPKINSAYGAGGMGEAGIASLENQLAKLLGFEVDGYVLVDLEAFVKIVDLVGGVEFNVPMDMYYNDPSQNLYINLSAGLQVLDGDHAIQLVRYRSGYASADIQRTTVQQDFMRALAKQCLQIGNVTKLTEMAEIVSTYVTTDLTVGNMAYFAAELLKCDFDEMVTVTLPGQGITISGGSYYALYANQVLEIVNEHFNPYDTEITSADVTILGGKSSSGSVSYNTGSSNHGTYSSGSSGNSSSSGKTSSSGSSGSSSSYKGSSGSSSTTSTITTTPAVSETPTETTDDPDALPSDSLPSEEQPSVETPGSSGGSSETAPSGSGSSGNSGSSGSSGNSGDSTTTPAETTPSVSEAPSASTAPAESTTPTVSEPVTSSAPVESTPSTPVDDANILPSE